MALAALLLLLAQPVSTATAADPSLERSGSESLSIRYQPFDVPFNFRDGYRVPSMQQSLDLSASGYQALHAGVRLLSHAVAGDITWLEHLMAWTLTPLVDTIAGSLPFFDVWLHEEWHRAVLGRRGIDSQDDAYAHPLQFSGLISVSHLKDEDLIGLKRDHLAELLQLYIAGDEALAQLSSRLGREAFFHDRALGRLGPLWFSDRRNAPLHGILWARHFLYMATVVSGGIDADVAELDAKESTIAERDFAGPDFTAWARDMFRPDEPYEARGRHPSGVGISRYTKQSDLRPEELEYLELQTSLHFLNLIDHRLFGVSAFTLGDELRFAVTLDHALAPFGYALGADVLLDLFGLGIAASPTLYVSHDQVLPGLTAELVALPFSLLGAAMTVSPRLGLWLQPKDQAFFASAASPGVSLGAELEAPLVDGFALLLALEAKSAGWQPGVAYLDANFSARSGLAWHAP